MAYTQISEADLLLPISPLALKVLVLLRIRCFAAKGKPPKAREIGIVDIMGAVSGGTVLRGSREVPRHGREAVSAALDELVQGGYVSATALAGNRWRFRVEDEFASGATQPADPKPIPDADLPRRFRRQKSDEPTSQPRTSRHQKSDPATAEVGPCDGRSRTNRLLKDEVDLVDNQVDTAVDGSAAAPVIDINAHHEQERRKRADAIEAQIAARAARATGQSVLAHLEAERDRYAATLTGAAEQLVSTVSPHLGRREDRDANGRRLAKAWDRDRETVLRAWRLRLADVAAGSLDPELAQGSFNGGAFGSTMRAAAGIDKPRASAGGSRTRSGGYKPAADAGTAQRFRARAFNAQTEGTTT